MIAGNESEIVRPAGAWVGVWRNGSGVPIGAHAVATVRHAGADAQHVGGMFRLASASHRVVAIHRHPEPSVDLAVLQVADEMPHVCGIGVTPQRREPIVAGGTGVVAIETAPGEYSWSGHRTDTPVGWEHGERREIWARGAIHDVDRYSVVVEFSARSFAGTMSDSGAPILRAHAEGYEVLGLACGISGRKGLTRYGDQTTYLRLDHYADWIGRYA